MTEFLGMVALVTCLVYVGILCLSQHPWCNVDEMRLNWITFKAWVRFMLGKGKP